jgi:hypothetical protein
MLHVMTKCGSSSFNFFKIYAIVLLQRIQKHAKRNRKRLSVVFLDLTKAFDAVSHKLISEGLNKFDVDSHFKGAVVELCTHTLAHILRWLKVRDQRYL